MVNRFFNFLNKEASGLHQAAYLLGLFAILSQILALIRDRLLAHSFGAGMTLDIYYAAFRIPDLIFISIASLVSVSVLIPFLAGEIGHSNKEKAKHFIDNIFSFFFILIVLTSVVVFFLTPLLLNFLFPGLRDELPELTAITRILLLSPIFLGLSNILASITQSYKRFFVYALSPLLYNGGIILGVVFLSPVFGIRGVVYGVIIGAFFHYAIQIPFSAKIGLLPKFTFKFDFHLIRKVLSLSVPRTLTLGVSHIAAIFLLSLASLMDSGSIAVFNFSLNLQSVPLSIVGVSYSLAAFPTLAELFSNGNRDKFLHYIVASAQHIVFWSVPITVLFVVLRAQIVRVVLGSGKFNWENTRLTAASLALFAISAVFQSLILLFVRGYYSTGQTKKPFFISVISGVCIITFSYLLVKAFTIYETFRFFIESLFKVVDVPGSVVLMLPLGYSLGIIINGLLLWIVFGFDFKHFSRPIFTTFFQVFSASIIMGFASYISLGIFDNIFNINTLFGIFMQGFLSGILGIICGIAILQLLKNKEIKAIKDVLHHKFWKAKVIGPDPEVL